MTDRPSPDVYDRGRPPYGRDAAAWATSAEPLTVLELGAGTGKLTEQLVALGHDVHATDPDTAVLDVLRARLPEVRTSVTSAEDIPASDRSYDVVVAAQSFDLFDHERALPEIARVLKPGGHLALLTNTRDERIPWVRKLGRILATLPGQPGQPVPDPEAVLAAAQHFGEPVAETFKTWQTVDKHSIQDLVRACSAAPAAAPRRCRCDPDGAGGVMAEVLALYADYGRGMDGMQLPYLSRCLRVEVVERPSAPGPETTGTTSSLHELTVPISPPTDDDTGMLLIDFR